MTGNESYCPANHCGGADRHGTRRPDSSRDSTGIRTTDSDLYSRCKRVIASSSFMAIAVRCCALVIWNVLVHQHPSVRVHRDSVSIVS